MGNGALPAWVKWLVALNTSLLLLLIPAAVGLLWKRESQFAVIQSDIAALKDGRLIKMADETRARFVDVEDRIESIRDDHRELKLILRDISDRLSRLEGSRDGKRQGDRSEAKPQRPPLPAYVPRAPGIGG